MTAPAAPPVQKPSMGRVVLYVLEAGRSKGCARPATVVRAWGQEGHGDSRELCNLVITLDGENDAGIPAERVNDTGQGLQVWRGSVPHAEPGPDGKLLPGSWHWPPRVS